MTFRSSMASTRACMRGSCAGRSGVWERIFAELVADKKNFYLMLDSTIVRAHQQAAAGRKKGLRRSGSGAFPRRSELEDPPAGRRERPSGRLPHHRRAGCRVCPGHPAAGRQRNCIERCFYQLKQFRRFSTRYCRTIQAFTATTAIACASIRLQLYLDTI